MLPSRCSQPRASAFDTSEAQYKGKQAGRKSSRLYRRIVSERDNAAGKATRIFQDSIRFAVLTGSAQSLVGLYHDDTSCFIDRHYCTASPQAHRVKPDPELKAWYQMIQEYASEKGQQIVSADKNR